MALLIDLAPSGEMLIAFGDHSVKVPFNEAGLFALKRLLVAQHMSDKRIAMQPTLTQAQVETLIKDWKSKQPKSDFDVNLEELGI